MRRRNPRKYPALEAARPKGTFAAFFAHLFQPFNRFFGRLARAAASRVSALHFPRVPGGSGPTLVVLDIFIGVLLVASLVYCLLALRADDNMRDVTLSIDGSTVHFNARESSVSSFLSRSGITLAAEDELSASGDTLLEDGMELSVARAFPVAVESLSRVSLLRMTGGTVGQALDLAEVRVGVEDELSSQAFEDVTPGMKIQHIDVEISYPYDPDDNLVPLYYREITQKDAAMYNYKDPVVVQEGKDGVKEVTRRVVTKNGIVVSRSIVDQRIIEPAVDEILRVGTKIHYQTNFVGETRTFNKRNIVRPQDGVNGWKKVTVHAITGYATGSRTAMGTKPKLGTIAINPKLIPYYTQIYVPGYGYGTALDTGAFRNYSGEKSNAIDLWFNTKAEAIRWGRKYNQSIYIKVG